MREKGGLQTLEPLEVRDEGVSVVGEVDEGAADRLGLHLAQG